MSRLAAVMNVMILTIVGQMGLLICNCLFVFEKVEHPEFDWHLTEIFNKDFVDENSFSSSWTKHHCTICKCPSPRLGLASCFYSWFFASARSCIQTFWALVMWSINQKFRMVPIPTRAATLRANNDDASTAAILSQCIRHHDMQFGEFRRCK